MGKSHTSISNRNAKGLIGDALLSVLPPKFTEALHAFKQNRASRPDASHDLIRQFFLNFLEKAYGVKCEEVEIEEGVKVLDVRGFIDALFEHVIFEFKKRYVPERAKALEELDLYFSSRKDPHNYYGVLTDGFVFEAFSFKERRLQTLSKMDLRNFSDADAYLWFDSFIFSGLGGAGRQPTAKDMLLRFGPDSPVHCATATALTAAFSKVQRKSEVQTKYSEWEKLLAKVYGSSVGRADLFVNHTYLSIVAKILSFGAVIQKPPVTESDLKGIVSGDVFRQHDIYNLAEPDFFMWVAEPEIWAETKNVISGLVKHLKIFDISSLKIDLLQQLYEGLVTVKDRHNLGEYYTPSWLVSLVLKNVNFGPGKSLLDPSCGSGSFLFYAVQCLRAAGLSGSRLVKEATNNLAGIEVHPVAVSIARCNFVIALGKDLHDAGQELHIPIYMADTLKGVQIDLRGQYIQVPAAKRLTFEIPLEAPFDFRKVDQAINELERYAFKPEKEASEGFERFLDRGNHGNKEPWIQNLHILRTLIESGEDHIWPFILRNATKPALLAQRKFDIVAGNPPWLTYRYIKDPLYAKRLKDLSHDYGLITTREQNLYPHMEMATAFFAFCTDEFLSEGGRIAFVLPRSVIGAANQHRRFQTFKFGRFSVFPDLIIDLNQVEPLFNVPTCAIIGTKSKAEWSEAKALSYVAHLPDRNVTWEQAFPHFSSSEGRWQPGGGVDRSPYFDEAVQGATIVPRSLWFVEPRSGIGPIDKEKPGLKSSDDAIHTAKAPWRNIELTGKVEKEFLFATAVGEDLVSFAVRSWRPVVIPVGVNETQRNCHLLSSRDALSRGFNGLSNWLEKCEELWRQRGSSKRSLNEWLDYNGKLTSQLPASGIYVVYNGTGKNVNAAVVDVSNMRNSVVGGLRVRGAFLDYKFYYVRCRTVTEAHYISAFLNTDFLNGTIKKYQTTGNFGERDICRRPFEYVAVPKFDSDNTQHMAIARLGKECAARVEELRTNGGLAGKIGRCRAAVRKAIQPQLADLDLLCRGVLGKARRKSARNSSAPQETGLDTRTKRS